MGSKLGNYVDLRSVLRYIEDRRHEDGGYCFVSLLNETNVNDTYYAVKIYDLLDIEIPEKEKTVEFLYNSLKPQQAVVAIAMAIEGLAILGAKDLAKEGLSLVFEKYSPLEGKFAVGLGGSEEFGTATPLEATYWVLRAFKAIDYKVSYGGFTEVPYSLPPYLEPTFYAVRGLRLINEKPRYIEPHIRFIRALQNPNGGFRRSLEMGISNFQNTYRALRALNDLLSF